MERKLEEYTEYLKGQERSRATIAKYQHDIGVFLHWQGAEQPVSKERIIAYKQWLVGRYAPASVNSMLAALNGFLEFAGLGSCRVKALKIQRPLFRPAERELTRAEYLRLLEAAKEKSTALWLVLQTLCGAGLRVSELRFVTAECTRTGRVQIACKGKRRVALLPKELCRRLQRYAKAGRRHSGPLFVTAGGAPLDRSHIWAAMKGLCRKARVAPQKVFPHNLRHLFARTFYKVCRDVTRLADVLGHSSVETTRIYLISTGAEHAHTLERLRLIL